MAQFTDFFPQPSTTNNLVDASGYETVGNDGIGGDNTMLVVTLTSGGQLTSTIDVGVTVDINSLGVVSQGRVTSVMQQPGAFTVMLGIAEDIAAGAVTITVSSTRFEEVIIAGDGITGDVTGDLLNSDGDTIITTGGGGVDATFDGNVEGNVEGNVSGDLTGDVYSQDGMVKILENGPDGTGATFIGNVTGNVSGSAATITTINDTYTESSSTANALDGSIWGWAEGNNTDIIPSDKLPALTIGDVHTAILTGEPTAEEPTIANLVDNLNAVNGATPVISAEIEEGDTLIITGTGSSPLTITLLYTGQVDRTPGGGAGQGGFVAGEFHQLASSATSGVQTVGAATNRQIEVDVVTNGAGSPLIGLALDLAPGNIPLVAGGRNTLAQSTVSQSGAAGSTIVTVASALTLSNVGASSENTNLTIDANGVVSASAPADSGVGLYTVQTATDADTSITAYNSIIVLPAITAARTLTIPAADPVVGSSIKISNLSRVPDGAGDFNWTVSFGSQTIMGTTDTTLPLDDGTASFELVYTGATWVIIGAN